jgi:transcriptional regulator with XRE-family HTH domain
MEKNKLIEARKMKGLLQNDIAEKLFMDTSCYSRREKGEIKITITQWEKLAEILDVPLNEIFEPEENQTFINNDYVQVNHQGTQHIYPIPESLLESQQKLIKKLEEEIAELKVLLQQK